MLKPKIYWPYTTADIGANKWIDLYDGVTNFSIDVTTIGLGAQATFAYMLAAILDAFQTATGDGSWTADTRPAGDNIRLCSSSAATFTLKNLTGAHTASNFLKTHFGLPNTDIAVNRLNVLTDLGGVGFPSCIWPSPVAVKFDSQDEFAVDDDGVTKTISGRMKYIHEAEVPVRMAKWGFVPPAFMRKPKATFPARTLEGLWRDGRAGFEYWNDQALLMGEAQPNSSNGGTPPDSLYTTEQYGRYSLDHDTVLNGFHPTRLGNKEIYSWDMGMVRGL
jgi:hypothetical protein